MHNETYGMIIMHVLHKLSPIQRNLLSNIKLKLINLFLMLIKSAKSFEKNSQYKNGAFIRISKVSG